MSSSETPALTATPWALDELAMPDLFPAFNAGALDEDAAPQSPVDVEAVLQAQYASERAQAERAAFARGRAEGERAVRAELEEPLTAAAATLRAIVADVRLHETRWLGNAEENVSALAVMIAQHLVQREITTDPTFVRDLVQQAIAQYPIDQIITVRVHPDDLRACHGVLSNDPVGLSHEVRWIPDPQIMRGGCLSEGRERIIDGRVDAALERAYRSLGGIQA